MFGRGEQFRELDQRGDALWTAPQK
jgi:hypothetical protein